MHPTLLDAKARSAPRCVMSSPVNGWRLVFSSGWPELVQAEPVLCARVRAAIVLSQFVMTRSFSLRHVSLRKRQISLGATLFRRQRNFPLAAVHVDSIVGD